MKNPTIPTIPALPYRRTAKGFTLMELLVVVAIIVILAGVVLGTLGYINKKQATEKCRTQIKMLETALEEYKMDNGSYPVFVGATGQRSTTGSSTILFNALFGADNVNKSNTTTKIYLQELNPSDTRQAWVTGSGQTHLINDPWGSPYNYRSGTTANGASNGNSKNPDFDIWSNGPDTKTNGSDGNTENRDNIHNW